MHHTFLGSDRHPPKVIRPVTKTPQDNPPCPWRLKYLINGTIVTETITARYVEDAALLIGKSLPIAADFDDRGTNCWAPVHVSSLSKLWNNPVLTRQQNNIELEADHAQPRF